MTATLAATIDTPQAAPVRAHGAAPAIARDALARFAEALLERTVDGSPAAFDLSHLAPDAVAIVDDALGEGVVTATVAGVRSMQVQETLFAGVWRVRAFDATGALADDRIEAAPLPRVVVDAAREAAADALPLDRADGAPGAASLLADVAAKRRARRREAHVANLTLLPLTSADRAAIDLALPPGPVRIVVRGFGTCRIASTLVRDVWRVDYFSAVDRLVLRTLEVVEVPDVATATAGDLDETRVGVRELVEWMRDAYAVAVGQ